MSRFLLNIAHALVAGFFMVFGCLSLAFTHDARAQPVIDEIMYGPVSPEPEWVEIFNPDSVSCELANWTFKSGTKSIVIPPVTLGAGTYLVLTKDSAALIGRRPGVYPILQLALPALRNTGDSLVLRNAAAVTIDSFYYLPSWGGGNGASLERREAQRSPTDAGNWGNSLDISGATPGRKNSIEYLIIDTPIIPPLAIVVNEIMFAPNKPEPEWIELLNTSHLDTIDIGGWNLTVSHYAPCQIPFQMSRIPPGSMVVITASDSALATVRRIPRAKIIAVPLPALSNSGSTIALHDLRGITIDSVSYNGSWISRDGTSIERIDALELGYGTSNWKACEDTTGCTIVVPNSVRIRNYDVALVGYYTSDSSVTVTLANAGRDTVHATSILIAGLDTITKTINETIASHDSISVTIVLPPFYGVDSILAFVLDSKDNRTSNDTLRCVIGVPIPLDSLVINEILFQPEVASCEWIEVYNPSSRRVCLAASAMLVGSRLLSTFSLPQLMVPTNGFGVIAADTTIFSTYTRLLAEWNVGILHRSTLDLSNDSASIVLRNSDHTTIDSVRYFASWHNTLRPDVTGVSLERRSWNKPSNNPANWQSSNDSAGATPLARNSAITSVRQLTSSQTFAALFDVNPFSPDGDGFEDLSTLTIQSGDDLQYALRARLFDSRGRSVRTLSDATTMTGSATILFDGKRDNGQTLLPGLYTALIELSSQDPPRTMKKIVGIAIAGKRK